MWRMWPKQSEHDRLYKHNCELIAEVRDLRKQLETVQYRLMISEEAVERYHKEYVEMNHG